MKEDQLPNNTDLGYSVHKSQKARDKKKSHKHNVCRTFIGSGETGIRTPGTSQYNGFQDRRNRPLCHLSKTLLEECFSFRKRCKGRHYFYICKL